MRVKARKGEKTAIVAVARKMLTIIWHLLKKGETYVEEGFGNIVRTRRAVFGGQVSLEEMAAVLRGAGYWLVVRAVRCKKIFHSKNGFNSASHIRVDH